MKQQRHTHTNKINTITKKIERTKIKRNDKMEQRERMVNGKTKPS